MSEEKYRKLFNYLEAKEVPNKLEEQILNLINEKEKRSSKIRPWIFGASSAVSLGFSVWAIIYLAESVRQTGFWQYFSLLFSGDSTVYSYWKELSLSLAESFPIFSAILFFAAIGFFIWTFAKMLSNMHKNKILLKFN